MSKAPNRPMTASHAQRCGLSMQCVTTTPWSKPPRALMLCSHVTALLQPVNLPALEGPPSNSTGNASRRARWLGCQVGHLAVLQAPRSTTSGRHRGRPSTRNYLISEPPAAGISWTAGVGDDLQSLFGLESRDEPENSLAFAYTRVDALQERQEQGTCSSPSR